VSADSTTDRPGGGPRRYSGKVTALIILAIVAVFVALNLMSDTFVPEPDRPASTPTIVPASP
jgi:hypothetical protein